MTKQNVALVVGSTGIVGEALMELLSKPDTQGGPWKVYGLARRPRPSWLSPEDLYVQCDLVNKDDCVAKISPLTDVTHVFWVTWVARQTEVENCAANGEALRNALDALLPVAKGLEHVALQTGGKHYRGSFEAMVTGKGVIPYDTPYTEDLPRQPSLNFYYTLEDILYETVEQSKGKLTWSVHRPTVIFGLAAGNMMNLLGSLGVYAAICKHEGIPFTFPGNQRGWDIVRDASNSDLIAEQEIWAATDPKAKNQAYNTVNGDVFKWKKVWKSVAEKLGMEFVPFNGQPIKLGEIMKDKEPVWDKLVKEHGLYPAKLEDVGQWWFVEVYLSPDEDKLMDNNKSKEFGFSGFRNTEKSFLAFFDKMRERKLIP
ncbi:unnamed protein product [Calypogeia fissa]